MINKYLTKIANFRPKKSDKPNEKWKNDTEFKGRFAAMFDKAVNKRQLDKDKVKNYKWNNSIGHHDDSGKLMRMVVPSKTEPNKHLELKHPEYKKK